MQVAGIRRVRGPVEMTEVAEPRPLADDAQLRPGRDDLYAPELINAGFDTDTARGDVDAALAQAAVTLDATSRGRRSGGRQGDGALRADLLSSRAVPRARPLR